MVRRNYLSFVSSIRRVHVNANMVPSPVIGDRNPASIPKFSFNCSLGIGATIFKSPRSQRIGLKKMSVHDII